MLKRKSMLILKLRLLCQFLSKIFKIANENKNLNNLSMLAMFNYVSQKKIQKYMKSK